jgi:chemotaxis protein MotB
LTKKEEAVRKLIIGFLLLAMAVVFLTGCASHKEELLAKDAEIDSLQQKVSDLQSNLDQLKQRNQQLQNDLDSVSSRGKMTMEKLDQTTVLRVPNDVLFQSGHASLTSEGKKLLDDISSVMKKYSDYDIRVEGHTDSIPIKPEYRNIFPSNWELSTARATQVVHYLVSENGIDPRRLSAVGQGKYRPVATNATAEGRSQNRRVEFYFMPKLNVRTVGQEKTQQYMP